MSGTEDTNPSVKDEAYDPNRDGENQESDVVSAEVTTPVVTPAEAVAPVEGGEQLTENAELPPAEECPEIKAEDDNPPVMRADSEDYDDDPNQHNRSIVKLRGLPWSATRDEILEFMTGCNVKDGVEGIRMVSRHGPIRGEAFVELEMPSDVDTAMAKHREHMGSRYIEVFRSSVGEMNHALNPKASANWRDPVVRLRGIPYYCTKDDIYDFFSGMQIAHNGVYISTDDSGNASGIAFVAFTKMDIAHKALEKHRMMIGHRYVEVFQSTYAEARSRMLDDIEVNGRMPFNPRYSTPDHSYSRGPPSMRDYGRAAGYDHPGYPRMDPRTGRPYESWSGDMMPPSPTSSSYRYPMSSIPYTSAPANAHNLPRRIVMSGLPFSCSEMELGEFFKPLRPIKVTIKYDERGRSSGQAIAEFMNHEEALEALKLDKQYIGNRYVDLSMDHNPPPPPPPGSTDIYGEAYPNATGNGGAAGYATGGAGASTSGDRMRSQLY